MSICCVIIHSQINILLSDAVFMFIFSRQYWKKQTVVWVHTTSQHLTDFFLKKKLAEVWKSSSVWSTKILAHRTADFKFTVPPSSFSKLKNREDSKSPR